MKTSNILKAWKSTIIGLLLIALICAGVWSGKLSEEFLTGLIPSVYLIISNLFNEGKDKDSGAEPE